MTDNNNQDKENQNKNVQINSMPDDTQYENNLDEDITPDDVDALMDAQDYDNEANHPDLIIDKTHQEDNAQAPEVEINHHNLRDSNEARLQDKTVNQSNDDVNNMHNSNDHHTKNHDKADFAFSGDEDDHFHKNKETNDEINSVESISNDVISEKGKKLDLKLIGLIAMVVLVLVSIMLFSSRDDKSKQKLSDDNTVDKRAISQALSNNMKAYEQQQLYRHRKLSPNKQEKLTSSPVRHDTNLAAASASPVEVMKPIVQTRQINLPRDCIVAGMTSESDCKLFMARNSAPSTIFVAQRSENTRANTVTQTSNDDTPEATLVGTDRNSRFANKAATMDTVEAAPITHPAFTIASGELIPAVLESAINSDMPGMVRAVTSRPVYGYTGTQVLLPKGSRLIGQYSSSVQQTQRRVFVMWNRVILPDGIAVNINSPSTDQIGVSGQGADSYETHFWSRFGEATLLSILGAGVATAGVNSGDEYNSAAAYRSTLSQNLQQSAQDSLDDTVANSPTLHVFQGAKINVFIAHDLSFYDVYHQKAAA